jgi:hypothetical protein
MPKFSAYNSLGTTIEESELNVDVKMLVGEKVITSASQQEDFTSLDIDTHGVYVLEMALVNDSGGAIDYYLCVNDDVTATNYYSQSGYDENASTGAVRANTPSIYNLGNNDRGYCHAKIMLVEDYMHAISICNGETGANVVMRHQAVQKVATVTNITKINIRASAANGIGVGSVLRLFKLKK